MTVFLKQSTAVDVALGPFLDATDGVTAETALTISQADVRLKKNAGAWAQVNDATSATHEENGWYEKELDATDTNTVGRLLIAVHESGALPVWHEFWVLEEAIYDAIFAASAAAFDANADVTVAGFAAGAITAAAFTAGAIDAAAIAANAIGASELAADAVAEIADAVWDEDATAHQTGGTFGQAIGDPGADTTTIYQSVVTDAAGTNIAADIIAVKAETAAIVADTGTDGVVLANDAITAAKIAANAIGSSEIADGAITAAKIADGAIDAATFAADVDAEILSYIVDDATRIDASDLNSKIDSLTFTTANQVDANMLAISSDGPAADNLEALMDGVVSAAVNDAGATTTAFIADGFTEATNDHFNGRLITFISGALAGQQTAITDYVGATQTFTVTALTEAPANNDLFVIH